MSLKLRELIKKVRSCKTAEEERSILNKESAEMRNLGKDQTNIIKSRNILKCIFMQMMGYTTNFIHVNCINLLASNTFTEKRVAYLGICLLMDENSEVLLLTANQIKKDLESSNPHIVAIALNAIGEVCTPDMCREVSIEVGRLMNDSNPYIKKKAALAASKILKKCPEFSENYLSKVMTYFEEKNNGLVISGIILAIQIFKIDESYVKKFRKYNNFFLKYLKTLISISYSPEYDVSGVTDPFLQVKILEILSYLGNDNKELSDDMNDVLANVATHTEMNKNVGNSVLYELVKTINIIKSSPGLMSVGSNILGKLLASKDNNYKYIALNTLLTVSRNDLSTVQKHKNTILECLKDYNDISIKRRALDLIFIILNASNLKHIIKETLSFLINCENEFKIVVTSRIFLSLEKFSPNMKYQIDTLIKMLCLAGNFVSEETSSNIINLILSVGDDLGIYCVHKLFLAGRNYQDQEALIKVAVYIIGEYGEKLVNCSALTFDNISVNYTEIEILNWFNLINEKKICQEYILNALLKISSKFKQVNIYNLIQSQIKSFNYEVQQRAVEYSIFKSIISDDIKREIVKPIPLPKNLEINKKDISGEDEEDDLLKDINIKIENVVNIQTSANNDLLNVLNIVPTITNNTNTINLLGELGNFFSSTSSIDQFYSNTTPIIIETTIQNSNTKEVYRNNEILISYEIIDRTNNHTNLYITNISDKIINNIKINFLVPKYLKLMVISTNGIQLMPFQEKGVKKDFTVINSDMTKSIKIQIKYSYNIENDLNEISNKFNIEDLC